MSYVDKRGEEHSLTGKTQLQVGKWYHLALVFDGKAAGAERHKLYVNGVLEGSKGHPRSTTPESGRGLSFGMLHGFGHWVGLIDEVAPPEGETDERRRYYGLTQFGREVLAREAATLERIVEYARLRHIV